VWSEKTIFSGRLITKEVVSLGKDTCDWLEFGFVLVEKGLWRCVWCMNGEMHNDGAWVGGGA